jgi:hypothetical protein
MECDSCGTPVQDPQQDQQLMQYDRIYSQAMSHLTAGNWEQTIGLLRPLMSQYPTEKRLYLAVLRAATQDFRDIDMGNTANRTTASEAWDKLIRLNGVTGEMLRYGRQRYEKHREELGKQRTKILAWIFAAAFCSILAGILFGTECYFPAVLCTGGLVGCLYKAFSSHPVKVIKQLMSAVPYYQHNPFV